MLVRSQPFSIYYKFSYPKLLQTFHSKKKFFLVDIKNFSIKKILRAFFIKEEFYYKYLKIKIREVCRKFLLENIVGKKIQSAKL